MLSGVGVSGGRACAPAFVLSAIEQPGRSQGDDGDGLTRLRAAIDGARAELEQTADIAAQRVGQEHAAIFRAQILVLDDDEWLAPIHEAVAGGDDPAQAVEAVSREIAESLHALDDAYLRERASDIVDVGQRVRRRLGVQAPALPQAGTGPVVVVAHELSPSDTIGLEPGVVAAVVTEVGTRTSHAAILARQLGIPAVFGVPDAVDAIADGDLVAVDGDRGTCEVDPDQAVAEAFRAARAEQVVMAGPAVTRDGVTVEVWANAASPDEVSRAIALGADGIGLYRTEFLVADRPDVPGEEDQFETFAAAAEAAADRPIVFRTFDIGADKPAPGLAMDAEQNPFLGVRGIRLCLARPDVFVPHLRALARTAATHSNVRVMLPMLTEVAELAQTQLLLAEQVGVPLELGAMIEVPSAAVLADEFATAASFMSIGTNDLTSYVLAADRNNPQLDYLYDELHPAVLRIVAGVVAAADRAGRSASVCGELAGDPDALSLLVGVGVRRLSVSPPLVPTVKQAIARLDAKDAASLTERALCAPGSVELRDIAGIAQRPGRSA
jgi:phosphoenolpyruvate-protein phosphotransferase (PTS system enzyme I)